MQPWVPNVCGDVNNDEYVNIVDLTYLIAYLFGGGASPVPEICIGDVNNDDSVNLIDLTYLVAYLFGGGPSPELDCCNPIW